MLRRFLVRRIWRAFPELDGYEDVDCIAFVRLARKRAPRRWVHAAALAVVLAGSLTAALFAFAAFSAIADSWAKRIGDLPYLTMLALGMIVAFGTPPLITLMLRDVLLRRRLCHILRDTGSCTMCGYSLLGLPIPDSLKVNCPECGYLCAVDVSLSVLVRDVAGAEPGAETGAGTSAGTAAGTIAGASAGRWVVMQRPPYWTPGRKRLWKRVSLGGIAAIIVLLGGPLAIHEVWLQQQASAALAGTPTIDEASAIIAMHRPGMPAVKVPKAIEIINRIESVMNGTEQRVRDQVRPPAYTWPDFRLILPEPTELDADPSRAEHPEAKLFTEQLLAACDASELDALFAELQAVPNEVRDLRVPTPTLQKVPLRYLTQARKQSQLQAARARQAISQRDTATAERCIASIRMLSDVLANQAFLVDAMIAEVISADGLACVERWLASAPSSEELDAIARAWPHVRTVPDRALAIDFAALFTRAAVADMFSQPEVMRLAPIRGVVLPVFANAGFPPTMAPGTWAANCDAIETVRVQLQATRMLGLRERIHANRGATPPDISGAGLARVLLESAMHNFEQLDWSELERESAQRTIALALALERYRIRLGDYPIALADLVPQELERLPNAPLGTTPYGYMRIDRAADPLSRPYILYLYGPDGEDNKCVETDSENDDDDPYPRHGGAMRNFYFVPSGADFQLNSAAPIPRDGPEPAVAESPQRAPTP